MGLEAPFCRVFLLQELLQPIQRAVSERRGDNTALWGSIRRFVEDVFIHVPGFQPLLENGAVNRDVRQKPVMGNLIEAALDVSL